MNKIHVLIGTNNTGKLNDAKAIAKSYPDITLHTPDEVGITIDPDETGTTYLENAHIKRDVYAAELRRLGFKNYFVVSDDGGLEIDALGGAPGVHSRRWMDGVQRMNDQELVDYCLEQMKNVPPADRSVAFVGIVTVGHASDKLALDIPYRLSGTILQKAEHVERYPGYPFRALFFLPTYGMLLHDLVSMPPNKRPGGFMAHREIGLTKAYDAIINSQS